MLNHQLRAFCAHVFGDGQPVVEAGEVGGLGPEVELDGVDVGVAFVQAQLEVFSLSTRCCSTWKSSMNSGRKGF